MCSVGVGGLKRRAGVCKVGEQGRVEVREEEREGVKVGVRDTEAGLLILERVC